MDKDNKVDSKKYKFNTKPKIEIIKTTPIITIYGFAIKI